MKKKDLISQIYFNHNSFLDYVTSLSQEEFEYSNNSKWNAGQQLDHLIRCVKPVHKIFSLPKFINLLLFGRSTRISKSFDKFIERYEEISAKGSNPAQRFLPKQVLFIDKDRLYNELIRSVNKLCGRITTLSEKDLDTLVMPHPMFGKVTFREMIYFTIHHVQHHENITKRNLKDFPN